MFLDCRFKLENKISVVSIHFYDVDKEPYVMEKIRIGAAVQGGGGQHWGSHWDGKCRSHSRQ